MSIDITPLGKINLSLFEDEENIKLSKQEKRKKKKEEEIEKKEEKVRGSFKEKITFDGEKILASGNIFENSKVPVSKLRDQIVFYCLYMSMEKKERAFYVDDESKEMILIDKLNDDYIISVSALFEDKAVLDIIDYHFGGDSVFEIEEDWQFLKKQYAKNDTVVIVAIMSFAMLVLMFVMYELLFDDAPPPPPPPPPPHKPLSLESANILKREFSIELIKWMNEEIKEISSNELTDKNKKKIVVFKQGKMTTLSPEAPKMREDGSHYYINPRMIDGALEVKTNITYEQSYPSVGFTFQKDGIFQKSSQKITKYFPKKTKPDLLLSEECLRQANTFSPYKNFTFTRKEKEIEFKFFNMEASMFIKRAEYLLKKCPVYFKKTNLSNGLFNGTLILFKTKDIR